ncbi:Phosphodiest-domain-containing protein [Rhodofomes roseus]|uniref:Phosphodiest-domain-containing protein n=1 Tax=Rhodofomes roseus TaxID=34475 RepID=A0ABQ8KSH1_9APHY|nr:Phosphodiest-domain-containing protein [Rhodofomes roseus]KAH9841758.1 Phosphodiest-domain-containing protein [Rhodofomes roseus]
MQKSDNLEAVSPRRSLQQELGTNDEERTRLLSDGERTFDDEVVYSRPAPSRKLVVGVGVGLIVIILGALFGRPLLHALKPRPKPQPDFDHRLLRSNGTHYFKKSALIVSIDGLRADYLDRGLTPHLLAISKKGLRAKSMKPIFPTLTFPNHWALMTGLYAESHGIIGNNFWDPATGVEFHYNSAAASRASHWWLGEPMWETAQRAGIVTANLMWPGPPTTMTGFSPSYFVPWKDKVPLKEKLDQITAWIDLPLDERPQFIMAYEPSLDQAGHLAGPASELVNKVLHEVDVFARDLHDALEARNLTDIFDVVFVSDHGMTDTSDPEWIYIDDILGDGFGMIDHEDGWPSMGLRFKPEADTDKYLRVLLNASEASGGRFHVYTHDTMPERWHFADNYRIAPIYVVPEMGYALTNHIENGSGMSKGNHGYDNDEAAMHAIFVAHGPFSAVVKAIEHDRQQARVLPRALSRPNKGWHSTSDDTYVMDTFENVNIYNLAIKLLGIEAFAAPNNGTEEFWDQFF